MSDARYTVHLPTGLSGPYTSDDLVQLLRTGKASPDDRVQDAVTHTATTLGRMVPDAEALAAEGARNRVRRSTSDRLPRVSSAPRPQRTPLPVQQAALAAQAEQARERSELPPTAPVVATESNGVARKVSLSLGLLCIAGLVTWLTWSEISGLFASPPPRPPPLNMARAWTIADQPGTKGSWRIEVSDGTCSVIGPDGIRFTSDSRLKQESPYFATVTLGKPHPHFGRTVTFMASSQGATVMTGAFEAVAKQTAP
ncbi:MAG TPA: hypothetical protein DCS97_07445 [Planctomycetes bacterium]|nr:hypothetical protein [Planctomycetota bacterium]